MNIKINYANAYRYKWQLFLIFLFIFVVYQISILEKRKLPRKRFANASFPQNTECYRIHNESHLQDISDIVGDIKKGRSIFFTETSCKSYFQGEITINCRQACAVESAARANPNFQIYLLFLSPGILNLTNTTENGRLLTKIMSYENVRLLYLNINRFTKDTKAEKLVKKLAQDSSDYALEKASDILKFLLLSKFGGIYLDLDLIVLKNLERLPPNFAASESPDYIGTAVIGMNHFFDDQQHAQLCLEELEKYIDGHAFVGNKALTSVLKKICKTDEVEDMLMYFCNNFRVYPSYYFYPVPFWDSQFSLFEPSQLEETKLIVRNSYTVHFWNHFTSERTLLNVLHKYVSAYVHYAYYYCPQTYKTCGEVF